VDDVVDAVNFYVEEKNSPAEDEEGAETPEDFDPKVAFKSRAGVRELENAVLRSIRADARRARRRDDRRGDDLAFGVAPVR